MKNISIQFNILKINAQLNDSKTAESIWNVLPMEASTQTWGEEIYFEISVREKLEKPFAKDVVQLGDIGYWPEGHCFCIFFGQTPVSKPGEIRPASSVNIIGKVTGDYKLLKRVSEGEKVIIEKVLGSPDLRNSMT